MQKHEFTLTEGHEFIPLDKLLKLLGVAESGGMAHQMIEDGMIKVNGTVASEKRKKLRSGDEIDCQDLNIQIS